MLHSTTVRRICLCLAAVLLVLSAAACNTIPKSTKEEKATALTIDGFSVPYEQLRYFICNYMDSVSGGDPAYWTEETAAAAEESIYAESYAALKSEYAVLSLCREYGIDVNGKAISELVDVYMQDIIEEFGDTKTYSESLAEHHLTHSAYSFFTRVDACSEELYYKLLNDDIIENDDTVIEAYVRGDSFIRVKQILIAPEDGRTLDDCRQLAEELRVRVLNGEDFDTLVNQYGDDLYMFNNPDGYYICRGVWYKSFEDAAFSLAIDEVSDVVESPAGCSILLRCPKEKAYIDENLEDLCVDYRDAQFSLMIEERIASLQVFPQEMLDEYTLLDHMRLTKK